jgi:uncharacterized protein
MALLGLVLSSIAGLVSYKGPLPVVIPIAGVLVFTGLTAWDAQRLKHMALEIPDKDGSSCAVAGALELYLNVFNLPLSLLWLTPNRLKGDND